ncbi:MbnP family protein [uncultured Tenacibaculum sp.]|uniref:MbnP family protein n=1 Tax=uncultured Tenacibaculum sp. TaxID=174713 RepID=UPI0026248BCD|nr:MbnP family protein [uncultured Tenacibaculum sp.]
MKKYLTLFLSLLLLSCSSDSDELIKEVTLKLNFTQNWDGTAIEKSDLSSFEFTNKAGTKLTIDRLRYLISRITLTDGNQKATVFDGYKLIDLSKSDELIHTLPQKISEGSYKLAITFGFNNDDNKDGVYQDLNTVSWGVPTMLGGGYHFMQMDGKYINKSGVQSNFNYHAIKAVDNTDPTNLKFEDTFFTVELGTILITNNATIEIRMNVAEWFKNPNEWDLNTLNTMLMPNFDAQKLMAANGKSGVFSLGNISQ